MAIERSSATSRLPPRAGASAVNRPAPAPLSVSHAVETELDTTPTNANLQAEFVGDLVNNGEVTQAEAAAVASEALAKVRRGRGPARAKVASLGAEGVANPRQRLKEVQDEAVALQRQYQAELSQVKAQYQPRLEALRSEYNALHGSLAASTFTL